MFIPHRVVRQQAVKVHQFTIISQQKSLNHIEYERYMFMKERLIRKTVLVTKSVVATEGGMDLNRIESTLVVLFAFQIKLKLA